MPDVKETEDQLVQRAQQALSRCNWEIGDCAAAWTKRFARGRADADFGALIGLSGDQVYQRRRVWETFHDVYERYGELKWSHLPDGSRRGICGAAQRRRNADSRVRDGSGSGVAGPGRPRTARRRNGAGI
jgi:hypothetical protein